MSAKKLENLGSADIMRIRELLPHRYPFLLIDKIRDIDGTDSCTGIKNVTINEPYFAGHFPSQPIMPGVLLIEAMAQTAAIMCTFRLPDHEPAPVVYFMSIDRARFRKPVVPGDQVELHVKKIHQRKSVWKVGCRAIVNNQLVAEAELVAMTEVPEIN